jgi:hypothetical protein
MGASQVPAGSALPNWVQLATATASGSTVSFTSLAEYRNYKVSYFNLFTANAAFANLRFNNDSGNNYAFVYQTDSGLGSSALGNNIIFAPSLSDTDGASGVVTIMDANQVVKDITYYEARSGTGTEAINGQAFWNNTGVINRIDLLLSSTTFTSGSIKVYGCN